MNVLDLFSGIGGFSLGLERAGMRTVAFCEIDPFCRRVLAKHWPHVPCYEDVRALTADRLRADGISVDVICGGFPCQDISYAGKGAGLAGERSGLWREYARIIGEVRPRYVVVENVAALLGRGLADVLGDLAALGFDAEWHCIPASAVGAPHRRDRLWLLAYAARHVRAECAPGGSQRERIGAGSQSIASLADAHGERAYHEDPAGFLSQKLAALLEQSGRGGPGADWGHRWWSVEPDVGRVAHGVPARVDRLRSLGNAVVPQIPEILGRAIMQAEGVN